VYRRFVWRRFVEETFCLGDVLYICAPLTYAIRTEVTDTKDEKMTHY
jgi:hypothetical protein